MRQIKVELEKDIYHCPKRLVDEFARDDRDYANSMKKGKRYNWTKKKPRYTHCTECGSELNIWDEYHQRDGVCGSNCYMSMIGMSWSDFI
ncbi:hypothetical protein PDL16_10160 [Bacillus cereus group sp. BY9-3LC]|uniref:hypothetical protein n=1 Tax=Bacillus cereus group sp. BY9-3LC TaxID=3018075 RepID=UPI0022E17603|nr:hypothetical protein [Bacillus cereus group sp. BY9-3LC]MDA1777468.1 hypothetical protein [Bacillus cereus group sp. BY9-3LC]